MYHERKKKSSSIHICIANPAGNITIFVLDRFPRSQYQTVASQLLAIDELKGEQVAFCHRSRLAGNVRPGVLRQRVPPFALMKAKKEGLQGHAVMDISVSGCSERLKVVVDTSNNYTKIKMPLPRDVAAPDVSDIAPTDTLCSLMTDSRIVDMDGIIHVVIRDKAPTRENFDVIRGLYQRKV